MVVIMRISIPSGASPTGGDIAANTQSNRFRSHYCGRFAFFCSRAIELPALPVGIPLFRYTAIPSRPHPFGPALAATPASLFSGKITSPLAKFKKKQYLCTRKGFARGISSSHLPFESAILHELNTHILWLNNTIA